MTCQEFAEFIADYLAGALSDDQMAVFERHMAMCPDCIHYLRTYEETVQLEKALFARADEELPEEIPEDLVTAILDARTR